MATMLERLNEAITDEYKPTDQSWMQEKVIIGRTPQTMHCQIVKGKDQNYLQCKFDKEGENNKRFPYFNCLVDGLVCMCDYIMFVEEMDRMIVFLIELKWSDSPCRQVSVNLPFGRFICERLKALFDDFDKPCVYRKIGIQEKYNPKHSTQDYTFDFNENGYGLLPNPDVMILPMLSKFIPRE